MNQIVILCSVLLKQSFRCYNYNNVKGNVVSTFVYFLCWPLLGIRWDFFAHFKVFSPMRKRKEEIWITCKSGGL